MCNHFLPFVSAGPFYDGRYLHENKCGTNRERNMEVPQIIVQLNLFHHSQNTEVEFYVFGPCIVIQLRNVNQLNAHFSN